MKHCLKSAIETAAVAAMTFYLIGTGIAWSGEADWPRFRGPDGNGISAESGWNPAALTPEAKVAWRANVGKGWSSVAIKGKYLYTMGNTDDRDSISCFDVKDGRGEWKYTYPCKAGDHPGPRCTPTIDDGVVYVMSKEGDVLCLDAAKGALKWNRNIVTDLKVALPRWGLSGSPCIVGDKLILNAGKTGVALDKKTGKDLWHSVGIGGYSTPVIYKSGGKDCVALFGEKAVYGVDLKSGSELWSYRWETSYDVNAADPFVRDNKMFISSGYGRGAALLDISGAQPKEIWQNKIMCNHFSCCVMLGDCIYGIDGNTGKGTLRCLEFSSGTQKWEKDLGFGGLMAADGKLIVLNENGGLFIAEASPAGYKEISSATGILGPKCWTAPVLCRGMIFCRNGEGDLACVDVSK